MRAVYIEMVGDSWMVLYAQRRKHQRYAAATFYAPDHSREFVENWVRQNPKLVLTQKHEEEEKGS